MDEREKALEEFTKYLVCGCYLRKSDGELILCKSHANGSPPHKKIMALLAAEPFVDKAKNKLQDALDDPDMVCPCGCKGISCNPDDIRTVLAALSQAQKV